MTHDYHPSMIICGCGLRFSGTPKEAQAMFRAHRCELHEPESDSGWPGAITAIAFFVLVSFLCTHGWGLFK